MLGEGARSRKGEQRTSQGQQRQEMKGVGTSTTQAGPTAPAALGWLGLVFASLLCPTFHLHLHHKEKAAWEGKGEKKREGQGRGKEGEGDGKI